MSVNWKQKYVELQAEFEQYKKESVKWCWEDVISVAENMDVTMTQEQAQDLLEEIIRKRDASIGINWDVLTVYVAEWNMKNGPEENEDLEDPDQYIGKLGSIDRTLNRADEAYERSIDA